MARPTKYSPEMITAAQQYIDDCVTQKRLPTIDGLAYLLEVDDTTLDNWSKENPEFFATLKKLKQKQKDMIISDGFYKGKEVNPAMGIFLLKANHGMIETQHIDVQSGGKPIGNPLLGGATDVPSDNSNTKDS